MNDSIVAKLFKCFKVVPKKKFETLYVQKRTHLVLPLRYIDFFVYMVKGFGAAGAFGLNVRIGFCIVSMTTQVWKVFGRKIEKNVLILLNL